MAKIKQYNLIAVLLVTFLFASQVVLAADVQQESITATDMQEVLQQQKYHFWQQINAARQNPLAVVERLGLDEQQVRTLFGEDAYLLDQGLPPVAWNEELFAAADAHTSDMFQRIYYSHITPEGVMPAERIAATGYQAYMSGETLGALVFATYVELESAVSYLLDMILREELIGAQGVQRNIFSISMREVGIAFQAKSVPLFEGQPHVYLLVADFAMPEIPREFLLGIVDAGEGVLVKSNFTNFWQFAEIQPGGQFQIAYPYGGGDLVVLNPAGDIVAHLPLGAGAIGLNHYYDLRSVSQ